MIKRRQEGPGRIGKGKKEEHDDDAGNTGREKGE